MAGVNAKTAMGLVHWAGEDCLGQHRFTCDAADLGLPDLSFDEAVVAGARTLVIGIAPSGGKLPPHWLEPLLAALRAGLDIASGLHQRLASIPEIAAVAQAHNRHIHDVRHSERTFPTGTGVKRSGKRLLTVGTDCALGKKYTALALARALKEAGRKVTFRATGQTGILIEGSGIAIDAVVADFIAGAAEALSPDNEADHWDIIEGQGSLFNPAFAGVTLGLVHGSQPDALVLCHDSTRTTITGLPHMQMPDIKCAAEAYLCAARLTNPRARLVGLSLNTVALEEGVARTLLKETQALMELPCIDPVRFGVGPLLECLE
jgi:uncharacterized NAD-dependent epimerase/dehydratase family protein